MALQKFILGFGLAAAILCAQTPPPAFEVVSVKPAPPLNPADVVAGKLHVGMSVDGARVDIGFLSLADLIPIAYKVKRYQVSGPDWMASQRFDVLAKLPEGASRDQVPAMLQTMLADRFKLAIHRENKERSVYALVVAKDGPKLKESPPDANAPDAAGADKGGATGTGNAQVHVSREGAGAVITGGETGKTRITMGSGGLMHLESERMTMARFADLLSPFLDRPVEDMTGLKGNYQVALDISMADLRNVARSVGVGIPGAAPAPDAAGRPAEAASEPSGSSIFAAVQRLGLKLESRKGPVEVIVVDHVEKTPTEN